MEEVRATPVTRNHAKRLIYFRGSKDEQDSAMITQVCKDYETVTGLLHGESASRTLWNLYNLHAVRGPIKNFTLDIKASMSGPHHYFGWINPRQYHTIVPNEHGQLIYHSFKEKPKQASTPLSTIPENKILPITNYQWIQGNNLDNETKQIYSVKDELANELVDQEGQRDSLFDNPGILVLHQQNLTIPLLENPHQLDLSPFRAKIVANNEPWCFNQRLVSKYKHAQHKLRVVTYNYGNQYVAEYLMKGSGIFIERHEFIQAITPMNEKCGGFVMLGREVEVDGEPVLQLIATPIPFGYTLLVDVGSIHGDSTLTGMFQMAMTGKHTAMKTADTVFMKHKETKRNVFVTTQPQCEFKENDEELLLTSSEKSLGALHDCNEKLIGQIKESLSDTKKLYWKSVIFTINSGKTLGNSLPAQIN